MIIKRLTRSVLRRDGRRLRWGLLGAAVVLTAVLVVGGPLRSFPRATPLDVSLFGKLVRELTDKYVEDVSEDQLVRWGIEGMLARLDPYTDFYERDRVSQLESITTGEYGGVGLYIDRSEGRVIVLAPVERSPAARVGILPGDEIVEIDGLSARNMSMDAAVTAIKGVIGTTVRLTVARTGEPAPLSFAVTRENIVIRNVPYAGMLDSGIGYLKLSHFSQKAASEVGEALRTLKREGMTRLILDLRGNPGGLLTSAVDMVEHFVPKGTLVVSTHGRKQAYSTDYRSKRDPTFPIGPLVVVVDQVSASAAEIVAGAVQDLDRGVVLGAATFGKGLVQTIVYPDDETAMKLTTMRYYTPSGRSIDGGQFLPPAQHHPDSARTDRYHTQSGRPVAGGGGIVPDVPAPDPAVPPLVLHLQQRGMFVRFAIQQLAGARNDSALSLTPLVLQAFAAWLDSLHYQDFETEVQTLETLARLGRDRRMGDDFQQHVAGLQGRLRDETRRELDLTDPWLHYYLSAAIHWIGQGEEGRIASTLTRDPAVQRALTILRDETAYRVYLTAPPTRTASAAQ